MGKRGIPPKPTALRVLDGDRPSRINREEPSPAVAEVIAPTVDLDDDARAVWDRLAPDLIAKKVLTAWDADAFTTFCATAATYQEAARELAANGMVARGAAGGVIKSPYWQIMRDCIGVMTTIGARFGLTPSDRAQLKIGGSEESGRGAERLLG